MSKKRPRRLWRTMRLGKRSWPAAIDPRLYRSCRRVLIGRKGAEPVVTAFVGAENAWPVVGLAAAAVDSRRRERWLAANASLALAFLSSKVLSNVIGRPRPFFADCPPARHKGDLESFPSTHAAVSFAAVVAVPPLVPRTPIVIAAAATAAGRLLLGEHYPSDVVAGAALGVAIAAAMRRQRGGDGDAAHGSPVPQVA